MSCQRNCVTADRVVDVFLGGVLDGRNLATDDAD
jgi:hypothetical protein